VLSAGIAAGLTIGMVSIDPIMLIIMKQCGDPEE